jgi:ribonuclease HI
MVNKSQRFTLVFTDGACTGNPGPGGWGVVLVKSDQRIEELGGFVSNTTNNQMELTAAIKAFQALQNNLDPINLYTDSTYLIRGITQWIFSWRRSGWVTKEGEPVLNEKLWKNLFSLVTARPKGTLFWHYVKGHAGIVGNERTDEIAVSYSKNQNPSLFLGPLKEYGLPDIRGVPSDTSLPESRSGSSQHKLPYSYLSLIKQIPKRHKTWAECEQRVKGQSGAKFKKAMSEADEEVVLTSWGFSKSDLK